MMKLKNQIITSPLKYCVLVLLSSCSFYFDKEKKEKLFTNSKLLSNEKWGKLIDMIESVVRESQPNQGQNSASKEAFTVIKASLDTEERDNILRLIEPLLNDVFFKENAEKLESLCRIIIKQITKKSPSPESKKPDTKANQDLLITGGVLSFIEEGQITEYVRGYFKEEKIKNIEDLINDYKQFYVREKYPTVTKIISSEYALALGEKGKKAKRSAQRTVNVIRTGIEIVSNTVASAPSSSKNSSLKDQVLTSLARASEQAHYVSTFNDLCEKIKDKQVKNRFIYVFSTLALTEQKESLDVFSSIQNMIESAEYKKALNIKKYFYRWLNSIGETENKAYSTIMSVGLEINEKPWLSESLQGKFRNAPASPEGF